MQPTQPFRAYQRRAAVLLLLFVFIFNVAASTPSETPPPPVTASPTQIAALDWNDKPATPAPGDDVQPQGTNQVEANLFVCNRYNQDGRKLFASTMVYTFYNGSDYGWDIGTARVCDFQNRVNLTNSPAVDYDPALNFDASRVAFVSDRTGNDEIFVVDMNGNHLQQVTFDPAIDTMPAFSPANNKIVFVSNRSGFPEIYSMLINGKELTRLTYHNAYALYPEFSPDGSKIVYTVSNGNAGYIVMMNSDGTNMRVVTSEMVPSLGQVRWSPDGSQLIFEYEADYDIWHELGSMNADGTNMQLIQLPGLVEYTDQQLGGWATDGKSLIFAGLKYEVYQNEWYLVEAKTYVKSPQLTYPEEIDVGSPAMQPKMINPDLTPPVSWIEPLEEYYPVDEPITVNWQASDAGPFGLYSAYLVMSFGSNPTWASFGRSTCEPDMIQGKKEVNCQNSSQAGDFTPGTTLNLRTQVEDMAGNSETARPEQTYHLRFYLKKAQLQAWDVREVPLDKVQVNLSPSAMNEPVTGRDGKATIYFENTGGYQVNLNLPGTASNPDQEWVMDQERSFFTAVLSGLDQQVKNGHFTSSTILEAWESEGSLFAWQSRGREGGQAADLSTPCSDPLCLTSPEVVTQAANGELVIDSQGAPHVVAKTGIYFTRLVDGTWQPGPALPEGSYTHLVISPDDELFIVQATPSIKIYHKPSEGTWSPIALPQSAKYPPALMIDSQGRLHMIYTKTAEPDRVFYTSLNPGSTWTPSILLASQGTPASDPQPAMTKKDGVIYVVYVENGNFLKTTRVHPDGSVDPVESLVTPWYSFSLDHPQIAVDDHQAVYIAARSHQKYWQNGSDYERFQYAYWRQPAGGEWSTYPQTLWEGEAATAPLTTAEIWGSVAVDDHNTLHALLIDPNAARYPLIYQTLSDPGEQWIVRRAGQAGNPQTINFFLHNRQGALLTSGSDGALTYRAVAFTTQDTQGTIWQEIQLPETMHSPTLSFFYRIDQLVPSSSSSIEALVQEAGQEPVSLLVKPGATADWQHAWADLSPWLGKTVKLMLRLNQAAGEYPAALRLDEVSVASWTTPLLRAATPSRIDRIPAGGTWVRLEGGNLADGSKVYLGDKQIQTVQFDPATGDLLILVPASTRLGVYDVRVATPGGMEETLKAGLWVGQPLFAPMIHTR